MKRTAKSSFFRFLSLALGLQFIVAPLAQALDNQTINTMAQTAQQLSGTFQQMMMMKQQQQMAQQMAQGLQTYRAQQVPPNQVAVPIFAGCPIFMAETNKPAVGQRCEGPVDPNMLSYYSELLNVATFNIETYGMYSTKGNAKTSPGVRCLDDAETQFKALLDSRLTEVDKLIEKLNADLMVFQKANEPLLDNIKKGNALLFGTPAELLKDTKFDTKFSDPQCASMISGKDIQEVGVKGGYKNIKEKIQALADDDKSGFSAKSFAAQASNIKKDIQSVANQLSKKASSMSPELLFGGNGGNILGDSIKSKYNLKDFSGFKEALGRQTAKLKEAQGNIGTIISRLEDSEAKALQKNLLDPNVDTAQLVRNYKNLSSTSCIQEVFESRFNGIDNFVSLLENPNISKKMNREADNELKNSLPSILTDPNLDMKEKLAAIESISGVKNYKFKAQRTETINGVSLSSGSHIKVDDLFKNIIVKDCEKLANSSNDKGETPNNIVSRINEYHTELRKTYQSFPSKLKAELEEELLTCPSDTSAGAPGTCSSNSFSNKNPSFCLRTASKCASNMLACADKAQKIFDTTRNEQLQLAKTYKENVDALKLSLMADYMGTTSQGGTYYDQRARQMVTMGSTQVSLGIKGILEQKARQLDAMFPGQVYGVVTDEDLNLKTEEKNLISDIDPSLKIENPEEYVAQMKENLKKVREKIAKQNGEIAKKVEQEKKGIIDNAAKQKQSWELIAKNCNNLINQYNDSENQRVSKMNEDAAKQSAELAEFCSEARKMSSCPTEGEVDSLSSSASQIAAYLQPGDDKALRNYRQMAKLCGTSSSESTNPFEASGENYKGMKSAEDACKDSKMAQQPACVEYKRYSGSDKEYCKLSDSERLNKTSIDESKKITITNVKTTGSEAEITTRTLLLSCNDINTTTIENVCEKNGSFNCENADIEAAVSSLEKECEAAKKTVKTEKDKRCDEIADTEVEVAKLWKQYQGFKVAQEMGQQSFPSCNSMASGEVGKAFGDVTRDIAGAMQENNAIQQQ